MKISRNVFVFALIGLTSVNLAACGKKSEDSSGKSAGLPMVKPPVEAASPTAFQSSTTLALTSDAEGLSGADFKQRFFTTGPSNVFSILAAIDERISGINTQTAGISPAPACLSQEPVAYTITPWGQTVTMYAQCYDLLSSGGSADAAGPTIADDPKMVQWGIKDGITYLYYAIGAERIGVIATPVDGSTTDYKIHAWIGLGYPAGTAAWDAGSYGVMELNADSAAKTFDFGVAGLGFGYCGAQLQSDGTNIYAMGSVDQGVTCLTAASLCVLASDATTAGTCGTALKTFGLPPLGRAAVKASEGNKLSTSFGASAYPATGTLVTLNGTGTDAIYFGPLTPTPGTGTLK